MEILSTAVDYGVDHDKEIPVEERIGSAAYSMTLLCKQDKQQLDRIESMLKELLDANTN